MSAFLPFLQLCRLPTVFTAIADVFLGYLLVHASLTSGSVRPVPDFVLLLLATSGLYLSGMVFNDVFDRQRDAAERPERPIPSGRVSLQAAVVVGIALMLAGLVSAAFAGRYTPVVAVMLAVCVLAYDVGFKHTVLGPMVMGGCRFLNIIMAASSDWLLFEQLWWRPQIWVAAGMGVYITGVTWFARTEARRSRRSLLVLAALVINLGLTILIGWAVNWPSQQRTGVMLALGVVVLTINRRLFLAVFDPGAARVQAAIKTALLSIIMLDAILVYTKLGSEGAGYAIAVAALVGPAMFIGRWIRLT